MSKSRSGGSKGSRDNSVENEDSKEQNDQTQLQLTTSNNRLETPGSEINGLSIKGNESMTGVVPSSPPPSYEHVLEETRLELSTSDAQEEDAEEDVEAQQQQHTSKNEKSTSSGSKKTPAKGPEILHKSSKEFYRAMAKQWGITCKMSDHCRCLDCQSHYFDCEYEKDEQEKTDGGLGAGTPMFISEVMHGTACILL